MSYSLGVIGGMGPKASSFFLDRLYNKITHLTDKDYPDIVMFSASSFSDRTHAILSGETASLYARFQECVQGLSKLGVSEIIVLCFTMHAIIRSPSEHAQNAIVMLDTVLINLVKKYNKKTLLLCTKGTLKSGLFTSDSESLLVPLDASDITRIHEMIYTIKHTGVNEDMLVLISKLVKKYAVDSVAYGCTEFHMLHGLGVQHIDWKVIDPLEEIGNLFRDNALESFHSGRVSIRSMCEEKC